MAAPFVLLTASAAAFGLPPALVLGPGSVELRLITAKLAARAGHKAALYTGQEQRAAPLWRKLMYGLEYAKEARDAPDRAQLLTTTAELGLEGGSSRDVEERLDRI